MQKAERAERYLKPDIDCAVSSPFVDPLTAEMRVMMRFFNELADRRFGEVRAPRLV